MEAKRQQFANRIQSYSREALLSLCLELYARAEDAELCLRSLRESDTAMARDYQAAQAKIRELIEGLPSVEFIRDYLKSVGAKTTLSELGLPDSDDFAQKSLEFAPYVRRRLTLLKLI